MPGGLAVPVLRNPRAGIVREPGPGGLGVPGLSDPRAGGAEGPEPEGPALGVPEPRDMGLRDLGPEEPGFKSEGVWWV